MNVDSALAAPIARIDRLVLRGRVLDPVGTTPPVIWTWWWTTPVSVT
ncbi:hypothetical protein RAA17_17710 [Komagataeibacter rhaeticus]|nr:hypothetical protein [Komagataeibacter rhaeticus]